MSVRWIDTIRHCLSQQTEQRRGTSNRMIGDELSLVYFQRRSNIEVHR